LILDTGCWIGAVFYQFFIRVNVVENKDGYLNKLGNKPACAFTFGIIENPETSIMNAQFSRHPLSHGDCRDFLMINDDVSRRIHE